MHNHYSKFVNKSMIILIYLCTIACCQNASGAEFRRAGILDNNRVHTIFGNWGTIGQPRNYGPRGAWPYPTNGYIGDFSILLGAEVEHDPIVFHSVEICPVERPTLGGYEESPTGEFWGFEPLSGFYNTTQDTVAMSNHPQTWPTDWTEWPFNTQGTIESYYELDDNNDEEFNFSHYNIWNIGFKPDTTDLNRNGLGINIECRYRQADFGGFEDMLFLDYTINNEGTTDYRKMVFGGLMGTYVGVTNTEDWGEYDDDWSFFNLEHNVIFTGDFDENCTNRNPSWIGQVGFMGVVLLESPGNPYDGIDNDGDYSNYPNHAPAPLFTESSFDSIIIEAGSEIVLIDEQYNRSLFTIPDTSSITINTNGTELTIVPGITSLAEGNLIYLTPDEALVNPNAYDGIDNDLDGLIDENYFIHYRQRQVDQYGAILYDIINPRAYINYFTDLGADNLLIDESGDNADEIGLTSFYYFTPAGNIPMSYDEELWDLIRPGFFNTPGSIQNGEPVSGEDGDYIYGSGYFPLPAGTDQRAVMAIVYANDLDELLSKAEFLSNLNFLSSDSVSLSLTSPSMGVYSNNAIDITWVSDATDGLITINSSSDYGQSWQYVDQVFADYTSYAWDITDVPDGIFNKILLTHSSNPFQGVVSEVFTINHPGNVPPQIIFTNVPKAGDLITGDLTIDWLAGDDDGDAITVTLSYISTNSSADTVWQNLAGFQTSGSYTINTKQLPNSSHAMLRLEVVANADISSSISETFSVVNTIDPMPDSLQAHVYGSASGLFAVHIIDSTELTGHQYEVSFDDSSSVKTYSVKDLDLDQFVLTNCSQLDSTAQGPEFDGIRLLLHDINPAQFDPSRSYWWTTENNIDWSINNLDSTYLFTVSTYDFPSVDLYAEEMPHDYYFVFSDNPEFGQAHNFPLPNPGIHTNFKIFEQSTGNEVFYLFTDGGRPGILDHLDIVYFFEHLNDDYIYTWNVNFIHRLFQSEDVEFNFGDGDTLFIKTLKPFSSTDIYRFTTGDELLSTNDQPQLPSEYQLFQNYPNPFNPITTIHYELPHRSDVQITIFDLLGRKVTTLTSEKQDAGYKSVIWNGTNDQGRPVSSGVYFYQIRVYDSHAIGAGDSSTSSGQCFVQTKKMILLK